MDQYRSAEIEYMAERNKLNTANKRNKALSKARPSGYRYSSSDSYPGLVQDNGMRLVTEVVTFEKE